MAIEAATTIEELVIANPNGSDDLSEGDDHIRLVKAIIKNTFAGINTNGFNFPIAATEAELNFLTGLTSNVQTQLDVLLAGVVPIGGIISYNGSFVNIPSDFKLCDGNNGTPNLNDRFVYDTVLENELEDLGGNKLSTQVAHSHTASHSHTGSTGSQQPNHSHFHVGVGFSGTTGTYTGNRIDPQEGSASSGAAGTHSHTLIVDPDTTTVTLSTGEGSESNLPPYYKLAFIQRKT